MDRDVFLSLLALDSYNRGYGQNVGGLGIELNVTKVGNATITTDSRIKLGSDAEAAGFYAIAYTWNGQTVISYRGTNFPKEFSAAEVREFIAEDFGGGWDLFTGIGSGSHAKLARDFYVSVTGYDFVGSDPDPIATGVTLTGHSLGDLAPKCRINTILHPGNYASFGGDRKAINDNTDIGAAA